MEALISSLSPQSAFAIAHASDVAAARRAGEKLAVELGFDEVLAGRLAIVVTEAGTNILKHAGEGMLFLMRAQSGAGVAGIDVLALDKGPGIADLAACFEDGVSTAGTAGNGLGALRRQSDEFDVWSRPGQGAAFFMRLAKSGAAVPPCALEVGALCLALAGEEECGDGWAVGCDLDGATLLGVDGLGHGPEAARAARAAIEAFERRPAAAPSVLLQAAHEALRATRGAALSVARIGYASGELRFSGVGNVGCLLHDGSTRRTLVSHNGIVGANLRKVQEFSAACAPGSLVILHSDGVQSQWDLLDYPGLLGRAPLLVAGILLRDFLRGRDDAMVLVGRYRGQQA